MKQRKHLNPAFLPVSSLSKIFPITAARARGGGLKRLRQLIKDGGGIVEMSDYFLHETQAQLQLALFGMDEDFMDRTNAQIRAAFAGTNPDPLYVRVILLNFFFFYGFRLFGHRLKYTRTSGLRCRSHRTHEIFIVF